MVVDDSEVETATGENCVDAGRHTDGRSCPPAGEVEPSVTKEDRSESEHDAQSRDTAGGSGEEGRQSQGCPSHTESDAKETEGGNDSDAARSQSGPESSHDASEETSGDTETERNISWGKPNVLKARRSGGGHSEDHAIGPQRGVLSPRQGTLMDSMAVVPRTIPSLGGGASGSAGNSSYGHAHDRSKGAGRRCQLPRHERKRGSLADIVDRPKKARKREGSRKENAPPNVKQMKTKDKHSRRESQGRLNAGARGRSNNDRGKADVTRSKSKTSKKRND